MRTLPEQFDGALSRIEVNGRKRARAIVAHTEIRAVLETDPVLCDWGVDTVLIGSYPRHTGIYPGKDVDVFVRLKKLDRRANPAEVYSEVSRVLVARYGERATPQRRSIKVSFADDGFAVDSVPAVRSDGHWAIPSRRTERWSDPDAERWVETDPRRLAELEEAMNGALEVDGQGAFKPTVKLVRQARSHHLDERKPGGLYFELLAYRAFESGQIRGESFAEIFASTLGLIAAQLRSGDPLIEPAMERPYRPVPASEDLDHAAEVFGELAAKAQAALRIERCPAGRAWREILGQNERGWCFPLPAGCDEHGREIRSVIPAVTLGSDEAGRFA